MSIQLDPKMSTSKWYLTLDNYKTPINMALSAQTPEQAGNQEVYIVVSAHSLQETGSHSGTPGR